MEKKERRLMLPVLAGFFIMGFCDIVAPVTSRIVAELPAGDAARASFLPTMVFLWFLLLSAPVAALMNRWGRKRTALAGYALTALGLMVPYVAGKGCSLGWFFAGFGLLGIGNTVVQVAVNPLLAAIAPEGRMTSYLTVGQIFRNTSLLLLAPVITLLAAATGSWRLLLPIYALLTLAGGVWLQLTTVPEPPAVRAAGFGESFRLLRNRRVRLSALGVACFIAADVGIGYVAPQLIARPDAILTTTGFYACRIVGTLVGAWVLAHYSDVRYLGWNMAGALALVIVLLVVRGDAAIYGAVGLLGFAMACVFATFFAVATRAEAEHANAVSGLLVLAIAAGALPGPVCGALIRATGSPQAGLLFPAACIVYMLWAAFRLQRKGNGPAVSGRHEMKKNA